MDQTWQYADRILRKAEPRLQTDSKGLLSLRIAWEKNKTWMLPFLDKNGRAIVEVPASFCVNDLEDSWDEIKRIANRLAQKERYAPIMLQDRGERAACYVFEFVKNKIDPEEFLNNKLSEKRPDLSRDGKSLPKNTKTTTYLSNLVVQGKLFEPGVGTFRHYGRGNSELVTEFVIDLYSQIISIFKKDKNDKVILSVNPLDMILASNHTHNWKSCHRIFGGEHRCGPLSYLCDSISLIAYSTRTTDRIDGFDIEWPRKIWRQMVFVDKVRQSAFMSREYPNGNPNYSRASRSLTAEFLSKICGTELHWKVKFIAGKGVNDDDDPESNGEREMSLAENNWHYRDSPWAAIRMLPDGRYPRLKPGIDALPCLHCGKPRDDDHTGDLVCDSCNPRAHCALCGDLLDEDDRCGDNEGLYYCRDCWEENFSSCADCGDYHHNDDMTFITRHDHYVCSYCLGDNYSYCDCCDEYERNRDVNTLHDGHTWCQDCIEDHAYVCDACGQIFPDDFPSIETKDGYLCCTDCGDRLINCRECGASFRYDFSMINGLCGDCVVNQIQGTLEELVTG